MSLWRAFVRFICRREIESAILAERRECAAAVLLHRHADYMRGVKFGVEQAFGAVEASVRERMRGADDLVTEEDLRNAKRGMVH